MMGKGGYNGGSTVIGPGSDWFSKPKKMLTKEQNEQQERQKAKKKERAKAKQRQDQLLAEKERKSRVEAERRRTDPTYLALLAERRRKEDERMQKVVIEVKRPRSKLRRPDEGKN
jgi:CRISPR/Cas system-associated exonuclease Cas4 (RecB family)